MYSQIKIPAFTTVKIIAKCLCVNPNLRTPFVAGVGQQLVPAGLQHQTKFQSDEFIDCDQLQLEIYEELKEQRREFTFSQIDTVSNYDCRDAFELAIKKLVKKYTSIKEVEYLDIDFNLSNCTLENTRVEVGSDKNGDTELIIDIDRKSFSYNVDPTRKHFVKISVFYSIPIGKYILIPILRDFRRDQTGF